MLEFDKLDNLRKIATEQRQTGESVTDALERLSTLGEVLAARKNIEILNSSELLVPIEGKGITFVNPHPYILMGAPYGSASPFYLREGVVDSLKKAALSLQEIKPGYSLHIFDGYRPPAVQVYGRQYTHDAHARELGFDLARLTPEQDKRLWDMVNQVWAPPSTDFGLPTPHSTGASVDLTIVDNRNELLDMGSEFDEASDRIFPNYYRSSVNVSEYTYHLNRELLNSLMEKAGFRRMTHEWWHFSIGDQYAAVIESLEKGTKVTAKYGLA